MEDSSATEVRYVLNYQVATKKFTFSNTSVLLRVNVPLSLSRETLSETFSVEKNQKGGDIRHFFHEPGSSITILFSHLHLILKSLRVPFSLPSH